MKRLTHKTANDTSTIPQPLPAPALRRTVDVCPTTGGNAAEAGALLTRLIQDESALYAITRDWRYNVESRKFTRLHALLAEQFTEIGVRLVRLAKHSRELRGDNSLGHPDRAPTAHPNIDDQALEGHVIAEVLGRHEAILVVLRRGKAQMADHRIHYGTSQLLADLIAGHEKDAFILRALLWEVENIAACCDARAGDQMAAASAIVDATRQIQ